MITKIFSRNVRNLEPTPPGTTSKTRLTLDNGRVIDVGTTPEQTRELLEGDGYDLPIPPMPEFMTLYERGLGGAPDSPIDIRIADVSVVSAREDGTLVTLNCGQQFKVRELRDQVLAIIAGGPATDSGPAEGSRRHGPR